MGEPRVRALVITGYGTNCEMEMAHACRLAGAEPEIVHLSDLLDGTKRLRDYHFLNLPGGFLDGDNLGAAQAGAHRFRHARIATTGRRFMEELLEFVEQGGFVLGVCNGFQLMVKTGLLPALDGEYGARTVSLTYNDSGRFEDRWVRLRANPDSPCLFTRGMDTIELPIRHGEGKFVTVDQETLQRIEAQGLIALQYVHPSTGEPTMEYPHNPNGSAKAIAGICDPSGRLMGLMPHPEGFLHRTNHPRWTRMELPEEGAGLQLFKNAVQAIRERMA